MLILTRGKSETIMIADDIEIIVVEVRSDSVRLGIKAPREIPVHRQEVFNELKTKGKEHLES